MPSWKIGSAFGIKIYLHWTLVLLPLWVLYNTSRSEGLDPVFALVFVGVLYGCIILHELGHALAARCFGIGTRDITMYPIGGVARLERMSEKPLEELVIAVAGPLVNVAIAVLLGAGLVALLALNPALVVDTWLGQFLRFLLWANLVLVVFNMIPAFPMDGGRVFRALLALFLSRLQATRIAAGVAAVMALLMALVGIGAFANVAGDSAFEGLLQGNFLLVLVAGFVFLMGQRELQMVEMKERLRSEEPLMVLPVRRPRPTPDTAFALQPAVTVYTWDSVNSSWVKEGARRPVRPPFEHPGERA